ncbi:calcium/sodium antiporter [Tessaracoccus caeni]|uniref:calcium/sodium antiporter n=1 Tax=Tessaracoccus caeni TaxID=3031239 RepID=UPI0023D9A04B|nr:calcium/sodium antiporter [Tessaracoccus caeni]MDF1486898.1 calcium/sodium antiporter [Tessaracoccus caeni]
MTAALIVGGLVALVVGAELLVRGAAALALRLGIPPIVVGLTIVSIGTSLPELAVGVDAARMGAGPLAVGNIAGTNVVNLLLILGLSAAIAPIAIKRNTIRFELPMMTVAAVLLAVLALDGELSRLDGTVLLTLAVVFSIQVVRLGRREPPPDEDELPPVGNPFVDALMLIGGMVVVILGADWLVDGAVDAARALGVSEAIIGLTIVAIGTSMPELVTTLISTLRGERDVAIGNLLGSSVYNLAFILGATSLVAPLEVTGELIRIDLPVMVGVSLVCIPVFLSGRRVSRGEGIAFVLGYAVYLSALLLLRT